MKALSLLLALSFSSVSFAQMPTAPADAAKAAAAQAGAAANQANAAAAKANTAADKATAASKTAQAAAAKVLVNVNTASKEDLQKVPGIGPDKAQAIIAGRPYAKVEDLTKVKGIKEALLAKIKPYVTTK